MLKFMGLMILMIFYLNKWVFIQMIIIIMSVVILIELGEFNYLENVSVSMGLDLMSYVLILLSVWICSLMIMSGQQTKDMNYYEKRFMVILISLMLFLMMSFFTVNLFMFYMCFESSLIPTLMLILGWGHHKERTEAGIYFLLYTLISSLPLLMMILSFSQSGLFTHTSYMNDMFDFNWLMFVFVYAAFLVKLPMFLVHLWLPKAHVEAPVFGSMILASVLLKLGGYGLLRFSKILYKKVVNYLLILIMLSLVGGGLISMNCMRQSDMKLLVAYSSVSHMGVMLSGSMTLSSWGVNSSLIMMFSHGLCSSGLFYLVNLSYERMGTRSLFFVKGVLHLLPKMSLWWFLFCVACMAAPPSLNLLSEIGLLNGLLSWSSWTMLTFGLMSFMTAGYSLYLFSFSQHGKFVSGGYSFMPNNFREYLVVILHWVPLNFLIINSSVLVDWL